MDRLVIQQLELLGDHFDLPVLSGALHRKKEVGDVHPVHQHGPGIPCSHAGAGCGRFQWCSQMSRLVDQSMIRELDWFVCLDIESV